MGSVQSKRYKNMARNTNNLLTLCEFLVSVSYVELWTVYCSIVCGFSWYNSRWYKNHTNEVICQVSATRVRKEGEVKDGWLLRNLEFCCCETTEAVAHNTYTMLF